MIIPVQKYDPKLPDNDPFSSPRQILVWKIHDRLIQVAVQAKATTIIYLSWYRYRQQQQKIEEKGTWTIEEEMFLPRTLEIKFGEKYSKKCWRRNVFYLVHSK